jgi:hypothetical protein
MKKKILFALLAVAGITVLFTACSESLNDAGDDLALLEKSAQVGPRGCTGCDFTAVLTQDEINGLLHMREEEKVARDAYLKFNEMYGSVIFKNIAASEQKHMDAVLALIVGYGLDDPVKDKEIGEFTDYFQPVYDNFIAMGESIVEALEVGVAIEEMDIADLNEYLLTTFTPNLVQVYEKLLAASETHLNAFQTRL